MGCCCSKTDESISSAKRNAATRSKAGVRKADRSSSDKDNSRSAVGGTQVRLYVALWDYQKGSNAELTFSKGDLFKEIGDECDAGPEWMFVTQCDKDARESKKSVRTGTGYIPRNFVALVNSLDAENYWFGHISRMEAESLLLGTPDGTFLIRARTGGEFMPRYALSVSHQGRVKHFKIHCNQDPANPSHHIGRRRFRDVRDVVPWFRDRRNAVGICCPLTDSPPRPAPQRGVLSAEVCKHWQEIPRSQIRIECEIGKGFYGLVHRGTWEPSPGVKLRVAVKELKRGVIGGRDEFLAEAVALKNLRHERLVKLHGVVSADEPFYIICVNKPNWDDILSEDKSLFQEYIRDGSLRLYLRRRTREMRYLEEAQLIAIACQVAEGMRFLEEKKVVHRDLAARNVLVQEVDNSGKSEKLSPSQQFDVKIADFGLAQMMKSGGAVKEKRSINLPTKWMAPEALMEGKFSSASDAWSFGVLLYEIFTHGGEPYDGMTTQQTRKYVLEERRQLPRPSGMPDKIHTLMAQCCEFEAKSRPSFQQTHFYLETYYENTYYSYERGR